MIFIGERINGSFKDIAAAIKERDPQPLQEWARRQTAAGATYLDINMGAASRDPADIAWMVEAVQEAVDTPLAIDSTNVAVIRAGLSACDGKRSVIINSTTADPGKLEELVPLAVEHDASLIGVVMDERGSPQDVDRRVENAATIFAAATEAGLPPERIFLDPIVMPLKFMQDQAAHVLEAIRQFTLLSDPPPHISVGLSNICSKAAERRLISRTFLVMAIASGLDAAICDVTDRELMHAAVTAELVMNREIYSDGYLKVASMKMKG